LPSESQSNIEHSSRLNAEEYLESVFSRLNAEEYLESVFNLSAYTFSCIKMHMECYFNFRHGNTHLPVLCLLLFWGKGQRTRKCL